MDQILLIDDQKIIREMLTVRLKDQGYDVISAENGKEGLKKFRKHMPSVTILDLKMPKMTGIELLRQLEPDVFNDHAIIVLTGHGEDEDVEECFNLGIQSFLRKPVNYYELLGSIQRAFHLMENTQKVLTLNDRLRESNDRLASLLQNIPDIVWECDSDFRFTFVSDHIESLLGYGPDSLINHPLPDYIADDDLEQFNYKIVKNADIKEKTIQGVTLKLKSESGDEVPFQILANPILDDDGRMVKLIGTARDSSGLAQLQQELDQFSEDMTIRIDKDNRIVFVDERIKEILSFDPDEQAGLEEFSEILVDPDTLSLVSFAFEQKEDVAFPIEIKLKDKDNVEHLFSVQLEYVEEGPQMKGLMKPVNTETQLSLAYGQINEQRQELENSVVISSDMQESIVIDGQNLSHEILDIIKSLTPFAFRQDEVFNLDEYLQFIRSKKVIDYGEALRLLGNKIHGLKGTMGFLVPDCKRLCHKVEDLTRPLAEYKLVLTDQVLQLLKDFIYAVQDVLEQVQNGQDTDLELDDWLNNIDQAIRIATQYLGNLSDTFAQTIIQRSQDKGEIRKRKYEEYVSVSQNGYSLLTQQVKNLFYMFSQTLPDDHLIQAGNLYNEFLDTHQQIQKIPLDLSRYERLIPSLARQYEKEAEFLVKDHGVCADREFWNAIHEILNHVLKNSIIHGIESPDDREKLDKDAAGVVTVELEEDALNIYINVSDDGRGMDIDKIKAKVLEQNSFNPEKLATMSDEEIYNLVFLQGISTADALDDNAGRGVGLNAVQESMQLFQGTCQIKSDSGKGCTWSFRFPKSNVSLSCFIVTLNDFKLAIPEDCVEAFYGYQESQITWINQQPSYRQSNEIIQLIDSKTTFDQDVCVNEDEIRRILILKTENEKMGLVINNIVHHANLPIIALPEEYRGMPSYLGATLYGAEPVLVIQVS
ncbi:MAG: response regulator [Proteobacteria bacterium]|nr:response regulator [Pseudomonadota bacterium]